VALNGSQDDHPFGTLLDSGYCLLWSINCGVAYVAHSFLSLVSLRIQHVSILMSVSMRQLESQKMRRANDKAFELYFTLSQRNIA
jgi:hypothetical protein